MTRATNTKTLSTIEQYRAAARALAPKVDAPSGKDPLSVKVARNASDFIQFFSDVKTVYKVERASHQ